MGISSLGKIKKKPKKTPTTENVGKEKLQSFIYKLNKVTSIMLM